MQLLAKHLLSVWCMYFFFLVDSDFRCELNIFCCTKDKLKFIRYDPVVFFFFKLVAKSWLFFLIKTSILVNVSFPLPSSPARLGLGVQCWGGADRGSQVSSALAGIEFRKKNKFKSNLQFFFRSTQELATKLSVLWKLFQLTGVFEPCAKKSR